VRDGDGTALALLQEGGIGEERRRVAVGADSLQREAERDAPELAVALRRGRLAAELAPDSVNLGRLPFEAVEERPLDEQVVRALVVRRNAALVAPPEVRRAPVGLEAGGQLVRRSGRVAAGKRDVPSGPRCLDKQDGRGALCLARRVEDPELEAQDSPSASSCERSIAA
jgi:hypothetical protein